MCVVKPSYWHRVAMKESAAFTAGCQARSLGSQCSKGPNFLVVLMERFFKTELGRGAVGCMISWWTFFWLVGGEVIRSQHHQPSGSNWSGISMFVGSIQLTSTWWGFQYLENSSKEMAQNIIHSPWRGTKGPWLCSMAKQLWFCLVWLFFFLSAFSQFSD